MFVTDTHALAYYAQLRHSRLGRRSRRLFHDADRGRVFIHVPAPVLWELVTLNRLGVMALPLRFDHWCRSLDASDGFGIEPLGWLDVNEARHLPFRDPFDCLVAGTAIRLGMPLITKDEEIVKSGLVETIW